LKATIPGTRTSGIARLLALALTLPGFGAAWAAYDPNAVQLSFQEVATGLTEPLLVTHAGDSRLFVVEQIGRVRIVKNGVLLTTPFLNLVGAVSEGFEQGLLGLAFHPDYATNGKFYVNFTNLAGNTIVYEYHRSPNPDRARGPARRVIRIDQPYANHNGGHLVFGPEGYLYIATGDGGGPADPENLAQNLDSLHGKLLRIDVNGTSPGLEYRIPPDNPYVGGNGRDEIWSYGLRNPWRWSFDRLTGDLWIGDVGESRREEINRLLDGASPPGRGVNFGWSVMEGSLCFNPETGCDRSGKHWPITTYPHENGCSVTGGYVYRGSAHPVLAGGYLFGDFCSGRIWSLRADAPSPAQKFQHAITDYRISSFGEDAAGELYLTDRTGGSVVRIIATPK
jgi:glucose/arabinose dehydrogenase